FAQGSGLVERANQETLRLLRKIEGPVKSWSDVLPWVMFCLRTSICRSSGFSAYNLAQAVKNPSALDWKLPQLSDLETLTARDYIRGLFPVMKLCRQEGLANCRQSEEV